MSKKKTLAQKKLLDERKQLSQKQESMPTFPTQPTYSFSSGKPIKPTLSQQEQPAQSLEKYVAADLRKTLVLSVTVVLLELLLYFSLHHHILALPFIRY